MVDLNKLAEELSSLTVLEAAELGNILEEKWGVSAAAPVAVSAEATSREAAPEAEEKTEFSVVLKSFGTQKIKVIKEVRAITGLGLKEAKEMVESAPKAVKEGVSREDADKFRKQLEEVGAEVAVE